MKSPVTSTSKALLWSEEQLVSWMQDIRRTIHRYPELSFAEYTCCETHKRFMVGC